MCKKGPKETSVMNVVPLNTTESLFEYTSKAQIVIQELILGKKSYWRSLNCRIQSRRVRTMKKTKRDLKVEASEQRGSPGSSESLQQVIHVTDFSSCPPPPVKSHQHSLGVSRGSAHQNQERNAGSGEGSTQVFPFFQRDPRRLPRDHRAPRKPAVGASVRLTTGSSFRATPTYPLAAAMYFLDLAHRTDCHLHAHTRCRCAQIHTNAPVSLRR